MMRLLKSTARSICILIKKRVIINTLYLVIISLFFNQLLLTITSTEGISYYVKAVSGSNWNEVYALGFDNELARSAMWICQTNEQLPEIASGFRELENIKQAWNPEIFDIEIQGIHLNCCDYGNSIGEKIKFNITRGRQPNKNDSNVMILPESYSSLFELGHKYSVRINDISKVESEYFDRYIVVELCVIGFYSNAITFGNSWNGDNSGLTWYLKTNSSNDAIVYNLNSDEIGNIRGDILPVVFVETSDIESVLGSDTLQDEVVVFCENVNDYIYAQGDRLGNTVGTILQKLFEYLFIGILLTIVDVILFTDSEAAFSHICFLLGRKKSTSIFLVFLSRLLIITLGVFIGFVFYINNLSIGSTGGIVISGNIGFKSMLWGLAIMTVYSLITFAISFVLGKEVREYD